MKGVIIFNIQYSIIPSDKKDDGVTLNIGTMIGELRIVIAASSKPVVADELHGEFRNGLACMKEKVTEAVTKGIKDSIKQTDNPTINMDKLFGQLKVEIDY